MLWLKIRLVSFAISLVFAICATSRLSSALCLEWIKSQLPTLSAPNRRISNFPVEVSAFAFVGSLDNASSRQFLILFSFWISKSNLDKRWCQRVRHPKGYDTLSTQWNKLWTRKNVKYFQVTSMRSVWRARATTRYFSRCWLVVFYSMKRSATIFN